MSQVRSNSRQKVEKLLAEYRKIAEKLNVVNERINAADVDSEDAWVGHDESSWYYSAMMEYGVLMHQSKSVREELRKLGYKKI